MGNTWEVYLWQEMPEDHKVKYDYVLIYAGESFIGAVITAIKAKRNGAGCIKVEWR